MLVTCHPPTGCDIGCMTAWTFCLLEGCVSDCTIVLSHDLGHLVRSCCTVTCDCPCDCPVACEWSWPNKLSVDYDDEEYVEVNEDSPDNTPNIVETPRSKLIFGPTSSKSSSTSKHKNVGSVDSVVEEVMQQNADHQ